MGNGNSKFPPEVHARRNTIAVPYAINSPYAPTRKKSLNPSLGSVSHFYMPQKCNASEDITDSPGTSIKHACQKPLDLDATLALSASDLCLLTLSDSKDFSSEPTTFTNNDNTLSSHASHKDMKFESFDTIIRMKNTENIKKYILESKIARTFFSSAEEKEITVEELYSETNSLNTVLNSKISLLHQLEIKELSENPNKKSAFKILYTKTDSFSAKYEEMYNLLSQNPDQDHESALFGELMQDIATNLKFLKSLLAIYYLAFQKNVKFGYIKKKLSEMWFEKEKKQFDYSSCKSSIIPGFAVYYPDSCDISYKNPTPFNSRSAVKNNHSYIMPNLEKEYSFNSRSATKNNHSYNMPNSEKSNAFNSPELAFGFSKLNKTASNEFSPSISSLDQESHFEESHSSYNQTHVPNDSLETLSSTKYSSRKPSKSFSIAASSQRNPSIRSNQVLLSERGFIPSSNVSFENSNSTNNYVPDKVPSIMNGRKRSKSVITSSFAIENFISVTCRTKSVVGVSNMTLVPNSTTDFSSNLAETNAARKYSLTGVSDYYYNNDKGISCSHNFSTNISSGLPFRVSSDNTIGKNKYLKNRYSVGNPNDVSVMYGTDKVLNKSLNKERETNVASFKLNSEMYSTGYKLYSTRTQSSFSRIDQSSKNSVGGLKKQESFVPFPAIPESLPQYSN
ncbi:hypothetical protein BB561_003657 [Smittium simulii]|uniref:Uncharacterized protein n=1 Tax=Smittium simulii TaxID=133385 RepID=A0A2T9YK58_9FUNG|nr:hypothetical protein BB561_003657 [Smittium simulii]